MNDIYNLAKKKFYDEKVDERSFVLIVDDDFKS